MIKIDPDGTVTALNMLASWVEAAAKAQGK